MKKTTNHPLIIKSRGSYYYFRKQINLCVCFIILFSTTALAAGALNADPKITLTEKNVQLKDVIASIESKANFSFIANNDVDLNQIVSIKCKDKPLSEILTAILEGSKIDYSIKGVNIVLSNKKHVNSSTPIDAAAKKNNITGIVTDENGDPLPGVAISVVGTNTGVTTGIDGEYSISVLKGESLQYNFIGYKIYSTEVGIRSVINVQLETEALALDELVVVAFGTIKKSSLTGSISTIKAEQLADRPVQNITQALQGMVPGLNISQGSTGGELDHVLEMNIRGAGTIGDGSTAKPLVLIDGMEGNMNTLNPQDIESISVMKDAASATIYGSRAPFGVILITTKKGRSGGAVVNYSNNFRFSMPELPSPIDSWQWANLHNMAATNKGDAATFSDETLGKIQAFQSGELAHGTEQSPTNPMDWGRNNTNFANTNWMEAYFKKMSFAHEHSLSVSGGSEKVQYYLSANFLDQEGALNHADDSYDRMSFSARINAELATWARVDFTSRFTRDDFEKPQYTTDVMYHHAYMQWPTNPLYYPIHPDIPFTQQEYNMGNINHLGQSMYGGRHKKQNNKATQQLRVTLEPIKNWNIIGELNYSYTGETLDIYRIKTYYQAPDGSTIADQNSRGNDWADADSRTNQFMNSNIYTNYEKKWHSGHAFKITAGFQYENNTYRNVYGKGEILLSPDFPSLDNTTDLQKTSGNFTSWSTAGFFGRVNYNYKERYLLEVSARYDGSSRFLEDKRWNLFPSVSLGWNIKKESFLENVDGIDMLKIRGSWGQLGNQNTTSLYPFYQNMPVSTDYKKLVSGNNYNWLVNGSKPPLYAIAPGLVSSLLTWETVEDWNIGIDFGFLDNRLTGAFDLFNRKTLNMVGPAPTLPRVLGTTVPKVNNTDQVNKGWELEISWRDRVESIDLNYGIRGTISDSRRTITNYPNLTNSIYSSGTNYAWYSGKESGEIWGYTTVGIAQTQEEMDAHLANNNQDALGSQWGPGDIMYADVDGDGIVNGGEGTLSDSGDQSVIGNSAPRYLYGINADISWKGFDFAIFLQGVGKRDLWLGSGNMFWGVTTMWNSGGFDEHLDFWRPADDKSIFGPNTDGYYPKAYYDKGAKNQKAQTRYLQNGAYLRIKNIQLGYTIPSRITDKIKMENIRVFFSADNLATFTELSTIFDPETVGNAGWGDGKTYPISKVFSFGLNVTF